MEDSFVYWVHNLDPFLIKFTENFGIRWYGLSYLMGFLLSYPIMLFLVRRSNISISKEKIWDLITYVAIGIMIGARIGYVVFYSPDLLFDFRGNIPFWGLLAVHEGGMSSHGGIVGSLLGGLFFAKRNNLHVLYILDLLTISGPIGIFLGRIANFINGELVGRVINNHIPWAVKFPSDMFLWLNSSDKTNKLLQLKDIVSEIGIGKEQWKQWVTELSYSNLAYNSISSGIHKLINEIQSGNDKIRVFIAGILEPRHPSQLYASLLEGLFVFLILFFLARKDRKVGFISSMFLILYSIVRIFDELFRMPDQHIGFQLSGLTRGQILSIVMFISGLVLLYVIKKINLPLTPGWKKK